MPPAPEAPAETWDLVLVGGGLQSGLIALALAATRRELRFLLVEREAHLGGQHTWCFHADDIPPEARGFCAPLFEHRWSGHDVLFPSYERVLGGAYTGLSSSRLHEAVTAAVEAAPGGQILLGAAAREVHADRVLLEDGRVLAARTVVDARGPRVAERGADRSETAGYQKFLGLEMRLRQPAKLKRPVLMDARVPQRDGFRFFYVLPMAADRLLVEDTYFSDTPSLDRAALREEVHAYARGQGWDCAEVLREEVGVLPMAWQGGLIRPRARPLQAGFAGGWCHPGTGYSLPAAVRLACLFQRWDDSPAWWDSVAALADRLRPQQRFARFLNRLLFRWYDPCQRRPIFERFYRLPEDSIRRFYSLQTTMSDRLRILAGRPPRGFSLKARLNAAERFHARIVH